MGLVEVFNSRIAQAREEYTLAVSEATARFNDASAMYHDQIELALLAFNTAAAQTAAQFDNGLRGEASPRFIREVPEDPDAEAKVRVDQTLPKITLTIEEIMTDTEKRFPETLAYLAVK